MKIHLLFVCFVLPSCYQSQDKSKAILKAFQPITKAKQLSYEQEKENIDSIRLVIKQKYLKALDENKKLIVLAEAENFLLKTIGQDLYAYWQGTPWDFNGTTTTPKKGAVACGYFVTGLLQDAGYSLNRIKLSTCPSLTMMQKLTAGSLVKNLSLLTFETFEKWIKENGKGLYVVGLDFHTGFIVNDQTGTWFVHSNYIKKAGVIKEKLSESAALQASKTRYITCRTCDDNFLKRWLLRQHRKLLLQRQ